MRLRNYKKSTDIINSSKYIILPYSEYKGRYNEIFNNDNPIYIEIGMGKGDFIIQNAIKYPDINFIGIEKFDSVIARAIMKLDDLNLANLKLIRMDAIDIDEVFNQEIDRVYLNFSDPWPKKRHQKRRLTSSIFLNKYDKIFKNKCSIIMKTDNKDLFEYSIISLTNYNYKIKELSLDLYSRDTSFNIPTEYEIKFHNNGYPIYMISVYK